ncbi:MAG: MerR family transcriptional regulator [Desulfurivibrionaceae bacterium]
MIPDKQYFKISEVCEITGLKQHVLRYWENEFKRFIKPRRARSKQRLYRKADIENILRINKLLKEDGLTIAGAKKVLEEGRTAPKAQNEKARNEGEMIKKVKSDLHQLKRFLEEGD